MAKGDLKAGQVGQAIYFDGYDYLDLGTHKSLDMGAGDFTVMAWVNIPQSAYPSGRPLKLLVAMQPPRKDIFRSREAESGERHTSDGRRFTKGKHP